MVYQSMKARKNKNKDERRWKLMALESEYNPKTGIEDDIWDQNLTKDMIRKDVMWLIKEIYRLEKKLQSEKAKKSRKD